MTGIHSCSAPEVKKGDAWQTVYLTRRMDGDEARDALAELHDSLRRQAPGEMHRPAMDRLEDLLTLTRPDGPYGDVHRKGRLLLERLEGRS